MSTSHIPPAGAEPGRTKAQAVPSSSLRTPLRQSELLISGACPPYFERTHRETSMSLLPGLGSRIPRNRKPGSVQRR